MATLKDRFGTLKTTILGPGVSTAALKLPGPLSFKLVTSITCPPLPPTVSDPYPCAPGKAFNPSSQLSSVKHRLLVGLPQQESKTAKS